MKYRNTNNAPVLITGIERSGMGLIARVLKIGGATIPEPVTKMYENVLTHEILQKIIRDYSKQPLYPKLEAIPTDVSEQFAFLTKNKPVWFLKDALFTPTWKIWNQLYPNAKWVIVRRKTSDIIRSCMQTGYMRLFKDESNRELLGIQTEEEGWLWLIHKFEQEWVEMIKAGLNVKTVWPERMVDGDYSQVNEMLEWTGLSWTIDIVTNIDPLIRK